jgi:hypothetical protein
VNRNHQNNDNSGKEKEGMKTKFIKTIGILGGLIGPIMVFCGCSTVSVTTDYDHTANFGKYRTYAVEPPANAPSLSPTANAALRSTLNESLGRKGIREIGPREGPDLAVVPHVRTQQKYSVEQYTSWGYGPGVWPYYGGYYGVWYGAPYTYNTISSYTEGTLVLDFVDTSNQKLVFRGIGKGTVSNKPEENAEKIRESVEKIVAKLPATAQSQPIAGNYESVTTAAASP